MYILAEKGGDQAAAEKPQQPALLTISYMKLHLWVYAGPRESRLKNAPTRH